MLQNEFGGSWTPIFSSAAVRKSEAESYWIVGVSESDVYCVICKSSDGFPAVHPRPLLSMMKLAPPLLASDVGATELEREFMSNLQILSELRHREEMGNEDIEGEVLRVEQQIDKCTLRLIQANCRSDKLSRALELATHLNLNRSLNGAWKLVNSMKLPALAEKIGLLVEKRMEEPETVLISNEGTRAAKRAAPAFATPVVRTVRVAETEEDDEEEPEEEDREEDKEEKVVKRKKLKSDATRLAEYKRASKAAMGDVKTPKSKTPKPTSKSDKPPRVDGPPPANHFAKRTSAPATGTFPSRLA